MASRHAEEMRHESGGLPNRLLVGVFVALVMASCSSGAKTPQLSSQDKLTVAELRNGIVTALTYYTDGDTFEGFSPDVAKQIEPSLGWTADFAAPSTTTIITKATTKDQVLLVEQSVDGGFFCVADDESQKASAKKVRGPAPSFAHVDTVAGCLTQPPV